MNSSRHPHVTTLLAFDAENEPDPPDRTHPPRRLAAGAVVAAIALAAALVVHLPPSGAAPAATLSNDAHPAIQPIAGVQCVQVPTDPAPRGHRHFTQAIE